jgi:hypothetical protein
VRLLRLKLSERTLEELAKMVVGDAEHFPYRSSYYITKFFARCGLDFKHDGTTRPIWAADRLKELSVGSAQSADLPSDDLCRVVSEMFDPDDFDAYNNKSSTGPQHLSEVTLKNYLRARGVLGEAVKGLIFSRRSFIAVRERLSIMDRFISVINAAAECNPQVACPAIRPSIQVLVVLILIHRHCRWAINTVDISRNYCSLLLLATSHLRNDLAETLLITQV